MLKGKYKIIAIAAMDEKRVIGNLEQLPWHIPEDMKRFASLTKGHAVIMGRKTFDSLPDKYKPLPGRKNIVISRNLNKIEAFPDVSVYNSIETLYADIESGKLELASDQVWIIGGEQIYRATKNIWDELYLTLVRGEHVGDAFFPEFEADLHQAEREDFPTFSFIRYVR